MFDSLFKLTTKKTPKLRITGPLWVKCTGDRWNPSQRARNAERFPSSWRYRHVSVCIPNDIHEYKETRIFYILKIRHMHHPFLCFKPTSMSQHFHAHTYLIVKSLRQEAQLGGPDWVKEYNLCNSVGVIQHIEHWRLKFTRAHNIMEPL